MAGLILKVIFQSDHRVSCHKAVVALPITHGHSAWKTARVLSRRPKQWERMRRWFEYQITNHNMEENSFIDTPEHPSMWRGHCSVELSHVVSWEGKNYWFSVWLSVGGRVQMPFASPLEEELIPSGAALDQEPLVCYHTAYISRLFLWLAKHDHGQAPHFFL